MVGARITRRTAGWLAAMLAAAGALTAGGLGSAPSYAAGDGQLYLIAGLPGKTLDFAVDGSSAAKGTKSGDIVGPIRVHGGQHTITVTSGGSSLIKKTVFLGADWSMDVVAHLPDDPQGAPLLTAYKNDLTAVPADKASLTVAHDAAVPPADITVNGKVLFKDIANGEWLHIVAPVATYSVAIVPTGKSKPVFFGPVDLTVSGGSLNAVYAIGNPAAKTMNVVVHVLQTRKTGSARPSGINTGTGGQAVGAGPRVYVDLTR